MAEDEKKSFLSTAANRAYWASLALSIGLIINDLTTQEIIRELQKKDGLQLSPLFAFINDHLTGDVGDAFAAVFVVPAIGYSINDSVQDSPDLNNRIKAISDVVSLTLPYVMTILFITAAVDAETTQHIIKLGTPHVLDLTGAALGTGVALVSSIKFRNKIFPRKNKCRLYPNV